MHQNPSDIPVAPAHKSAPPHRAGGICEASRLPQGDAFFVCDSCEVGNILEIALCLLKMHQFLIQFLTPHAS